MLLLTIGVVLSLVSVVLGWWLWRLEARSALRIIGLVIASVLLVAGLATTGLWNQFRAGGWFRKGRRVPSLCGCRLR